MTEAQKHVAAYQVLTEMGETEAAQLMMDTATDEELLMILEIDLAEFA